jgi:hypothetical protein
VAIDFPNSPTTGDTYTAGGRTWQWDGTVWASYGNYPDPTVLKIDTGTNRVGINNTSPTTALDVTGDLTVSGTITGGSISGAGMTVSSSAPSSPSAGETWYNDTTGRTFVYYNDGSSQQWVEFGVPPEGSTIALASYADASARTTAIPSPTEADLSYLQDTNSVEVYDGSAWASLAGGKILQVVNATYSTQVLVSSTTYAATGLTASITPSATSSKVFVIITNPMYAWNENNLTTDSGGGLSKLYRDGSEIHDFYQFGYNDNASVQRFMRFNGTLTYMDSPATTSSVSYEQYIASYGTTYSVYSCKDNYTASITLIEVGA